jgi:hypothetical protein
VFRCAESEVLVEHCRGLYLIRRWPTRTLSDVRLSIGLSVGRISPFCAIYQVGTNTGRSYLRWLDSLKF